MYSNRRGWRCRWVAQPRLARVRRPWFQSQHFSQSVSLQEETSGSYEYVHGLHGGSGFRGNTYPPFINLCILIIWTTYTSLRLQWMVKERAKSSYHFFPELECLKSLLLSYVLRKATVIFFQIFYCYFFMWHKSVIYPLSQNIADQIQKCHMGICHGQRTRHCKKIILCLASWTFLDHSARLWSQAAWAGRALSKTCYHSEKWNNCKMQ